MNKVYIVKYYYNLIDNQYNILSVHKTQEGADIAIGDHKYFLKCEFESYHGFEYTLEHGWDYNMDWVVEEMELID